ncbi:MAG: hypothetical protein K9N49_05925 [Candidatus Marinimicrobia bacterium]|nr:hypothetical protein [Candidatus Neomarinimicrobiota bacterium]
MNAIKRRLLVLAIVMAAATFPTYLVFRFVYQPQLALRRELEREQPAPDQLAALIRQARRDRFDLTDTLALINLLEREAMRAEALDMFRLLKDRFPSDPSVRLWYADRLHRYREWLEAERQYLAVIELLDRFEQEWRRRSPQGLRASERELYVARQVGELPGGVLESGADEVYRRLAENALQAGLAAEEPARALWLEKSGGFFEECLRRNPLHHEARGVYASLLLEVGRPAEGLAQYRLLLETEPDNLGWLTSAALAAAADRRFAVAERFLRDALRVEPSPALRLELARVMSWGGKHESALTEIGALVEDYPAEESYRLERSQFLLNAGRHREYLDETARLAAANPLRLDLRLNRIRAMTGLGLYKEAVQEAAAVLALDPAQREAAILKAEALLWQGDYRAAQVDLALLDQQYPDDERIRLRRAQSHLWDRQFEPAVVILRPLNPEALADLELSQAYAEAVAGLTPPDPRDVVNIRMMHQAVAQRTETSWPTPFLAAMGRALRAVAEPEAATDLLNMALARAQNNLALRLELADLLQDIGRHNEADEQYRMIAQPVLERQTP